MPLKRPGSPALWGITKAGGRAMPTWRPVLHGSRRGGRGGRGHVRVLASVLAGTRRGRRAPGTVALPLRAQTQGVVGALPARHAQERGRRKGKKDGQRGLKKPCEWGTEAGATAPAVDGAHTHGTRRTRAREPPQRPQRGSLRKRATVGGRPASVHAARKRVGWGHTRGTPPHAPSACLVGRATAWAPPVLAGTRPKGVERTARARGQRDRSPNTSPRTARDRLSAPSDCSRWEALIGGPTCRRCARLTNGCVAHARDQARPGPP